MFRWRLPAGRRDGSVCIEAAYDGDNPALGTPHLMLNQHEIHAHAHRLPPLATGGAREAIVRMLNF